MWQSGSSRRAQDIPDSIETCSKPRILFRQRQHTEDLWEIGVARAAYQQTVRLLASLLRVWTEPGSFALAGAEGAALDPQCVVERPRRNPAVAADHRFRDIAGRPPLFDPHRSAAARALLPVSECSPVDIVEMPRWAAADETHRDYFFRPGFVLI